MKNVLALILGGGRGTRLNPLTAERSKPAVPLAGKYRLIDIPISNCLNSGVERIYVLTQFLAESLNQHIASTYRFDAFSRGFVSILAAEQTGSKEGGWFAGTADAVRKVLRHTERYRFEEFLILSGDHIYRMDYAKLIQEHRARGADITVAALEVKREKVPELGVMEIDAGGHIQRFVEKPQEPQLIDSLEIKADYFENRGEPTQKGLFLANMGIYLFNRKLLDDLLMKDQSEANDFGKEILPYAVKQGMKISAHRFNGYWEDIGTIRAFFDATLALTSIQPSFSFFSEDQRIYTRRRNLPSNKLFHCALDGVLLSEGCLLKEAQIREAVLGIRSRILNGAKLERVIMMGADFFESPKERLQNQGIRPDVGVAEEAQIQQTIIDKNARIGRGAILKGGAHPDDAGPGWTLRDEILVIHKNAIIPHNARVDFSKAQPQVELRF